MVKLTRSAFGKAGITGRWKTNFHAAFHCNADLSTSIQDGFDCINQCAHSISPRLIVGSLRQVFEPSRDRSFSCSAIPADRFHFPSQTPPHHSRTVHERELGGARCCKRKNENHLCQKFWASESVFMARYYLPYWYYINPSALSRSRVWLISQGDAPPRGQGLSFAGFHKSRRTR